MPGPIALDTKHWIKIGGQGKTQVVTARGFACYYSALAEAPEKVSEGTELAKDSSLTLEANIPRWFKAKEPSSTEEPFQPSTLEVKEPNPESTTEPTLGKESVVAEKIAAKAVTATKALQPTVPVASGTESLTAELGTPGVARTVIAVYNAKAEASAKVKIKHGLNTEYVSVTAWKASAKKATEKITDGAAVAGAISKVKMESAEEVLVTLVATEPEAKAEIFFVIQG